MARRNNAGNSKSRNENRTVAHLPEAFGLAVLALASLLTLSIVSYNPGDETILSSGTADTPTSNYIGVFGANVSAILIQLFGFVSLIFPLVLFVVGGCLLVRVEVRSPVTKGIGVASLLLSSAVVISYLIPQFIMREVIHPFPGGGVIGTLIIDTLEPVFSDTGLLIIFSALVGISLLLTLHFSFGAFSRWIWRGIAGFFTSLKTRNKPVRAKVNSRQSKTKRSPKVLIRLRLPWRRREFAEEEDVPSPHVMEELEADLPSHDGKMITDNEEFKPQIAVSRRRTRIRRPESLVGMQAPVNLLDEPPKDRSPLNLKMLAEQARSIVDRYNEFGIEGQVLQTNPGPVVNTFEFKPAPGVKYNRVVNLANELCMALKAISIRISRIAGKSTIGIEVPNENRETIMFRELIESPEYQNSKSPLTIGLGKTIDGEPYVTKLEQMPHLLIGGATGTGKSVSLNSMICSILYKSPPETVKFIMIDPKQVELNLYEGIPHLLTRVVSQPKQAASALRWACEEMEIRYRKLATNGVRNIRQFNQIAAEASQSDSIDTDEEPLEPIPYIVVVIDELADLMMVASADVEESICRLAQKARAVGIHLIIATQRPSVDVLTGTIKANFPSRISFGVFSKVDSRVILDSYGAEDLLGNGDMLFMPPGTSRLMRLHGSYVSEKEVKRLVDHLSRAEEPDYRDEDILTSDEEENGLVRSDLAPDKDPLYDEAVNLVLTTGTASISNLQRKMRLGYARAARIIDMMESAGIIGPADGSKPREILKKQIS